MFGKKRKKLTLIEQRDEIRTEMLEAFADNRFEEEEYDKLYCRLQKIDKKIRKEKK